MTTLGPDLIVHDLSLTSIYWFAGNHVSSSWISTNQGNTSVTTTSTGLFLSTDPTITTSDTLLVINGATGTLQPGESNSNLRPKYVVDGALVPGTYLWARL